MAHNKIVVAALVITALIVLVTSEKMATMDDVVLESYKFCSKEYKDDVKIIECADEHIKMLKKAAAATGIDLTGKSEKMATMDDVVLESYKFCSKKYKDDVKIVECADENIKMLRKAAAATGIQLTHP